MYVGMHVKAPRGRGLRGEGARGGDDLSMLARYRPAHVPRSHFLPITTHTLALGRGILLTLAGSRQAYLWLSNSHVR